MLFVRWIVAALFLAAVAWGETPGEQLLGEARQAVEDGETETAKEKFKAALEALAGGPDRARVAARIEYAEMLGEAAESDDAAEQLGKALETLRRIGAGPVERADLLLKLGGAESEVNEDAAEASYLQALTIYLDEAGPADEKTIEARALIGGLYLSQSWEEGASEQFVAAITARREAFGRSEELAATLERVSEERRWHDEDEALALRDRALAIRTSLYDDPSPELARTLTREAYQRYSWDFDEQAVEMYRGAVDMLWRLGNPRPADTARAHSGMAQTLHYLGRYDEAEAERRTAIALRRGAGLLTWATASDLCGLGQTLLRLDRAHEATDAIEECVGLRRERVDEDADSLIAALRELARTYGEAERYERAEATLREVLALYERHGKPYKTADAGVWSLLGDLFQEQDRPKAAAAAYAQMVEAYQEALGLDHPTLATGLETLRAAYETAGRHADAKALRPQLNRLAWLSLAVEYPWLELPEGAEALSRRISPTVFFGTVFLVFGLVISTTGGVAGMRLGRIEVARAAEAEPTRPELVAPQERPRHFGRFHGEGGELFGVWAVNSLLTVLTLGVYYFWGKVRIRRYVWSHAEFARDRFAFHGTPLELFAGWLKAAPVFAAIIWGPTIVLMLTQSTDWEVGATLGVLGFAGLLWPVAEIGAHRYRMSRTSWRGIRFSFRGETWRYFGVCVLNWPLWVFSLGLWTPFFYALKRRYLMCNMRFGDSSFHCDAEGRDLFKAFLLNWVLFLPTWGMYSYWYAAKRERYYWSRTSYRGARFRCDISGSKLFEISVVGGLMTLVTLGLAWPWVRCWRMRVWLESIQLDGALDLERIRQDPQAATATGEGFADFLGLDFGFFE